MNAVEERPFVPKPVTLPAPDAMRCRRCNGKLWGRMMTCLTHGDHVDFGYASPVETVEKRRGKERKEYSCVDCKGHVYPGATRCKACNDIFRYGPR